MDISRHEQRVLHVLAQGGKIVALKSDSGKLIGVECFNRDGWLMQQCTLPLFKKLRAKKAIASSNGQPYRITRRGLELARSEFDNR
ncbi:YjhX family toxin [Devosia sp. A16]|uniref:YjhX family toxin n=1 Tax=Devosia sp. A16 TaxID=1736675 RepID=UPI0006D7A25C|nr:YjhX family toxin [Devosia sp. A16]